MRPIRLLFTWGFKVGHPYRPLLCTMCVGTCKDEVKDQYKTLIILGICKV